MKFVFYNAEVADGFAFGLGAPDELDVAAHAEGNIVHVLGLDDHPLLAPQILQAAKEMGGKELDETEKR